MRRCQHFCGCEGNAVGRDPDFGLMLCAGCLGRTILGTDCSRARKYFGHMPVHFGDPAWGDPPPLRDGDRSPLPAGFEVFLTVRTGYDAPAWDFMPLAPAAAAVGAGVGAGSATNPHRPPKDPPSGPLPPPPARPVQPNPPRR